MLSDKLFDGGFGIERETLRVDLYGKLAQTPHPFKDKHLERDFCENQLEIITPVCKSVKDAVCELKKLSDKAEKTLNENDEYLWIYSNPPHIDTEDDIPVADFSGKNKYKSEYRKNLEKRYGKRIMLYSGIHFNFSFSDDFLDEIFQKQGRPDEDFQEFKNRLYLKIFKYASRYSWIFPLLTAASPIYDRSLKYDHESGSSFCGYASMRNSPYGYWNNFIPKLDYSTLKAYSDSVKKYIADGSLFSAGELYLPIRLKPRGVNDLDALVNYGVDHIELRMFDLNPLSPAGIFSKDLEFAHYFLIYIMNQPDFEFTYDMQKKLLKITNLHLYLNLTKSE